MQGNPPPGHQGYNAPYGSPHQYGHPQNPYGHGYPPGMGPYGGHGAPMPHAPFGVHPTLGIPYSDKSKVVAGLLQIFWGTFGVGRFYTGHIGLAVAQLLVCVFVGIIGSFFTCGISALVVFWPFIDGIVLLVGNPTDAEGRLLR